MMLQTNYNNEKVLSCEESDGVRLVYINDMRVFEIELSDVVHCRYVAVTLHLNHGIRQKVVADKWDISTRTLARWVRGFKKDGVEGLALEIQGAPVKLTPPVIKRIHDLRSERMSVYAIAKKLSLDWKTVNSVFKTPEIPEEPSLPGFDEENTAYDGDIQGEQPDEDAPVTAERESVPAKDPLSRGADRAAAYAGLIEEAEPLFADSDHVEGAGALLALAVLTTTPFFDAVYKNYKSLGAGFYGLRGIFSTMFLMAVLRIKTPEKLNSHNVQKLGRLLGLDRAPSVRTLRDKIRILANRKKSMQLMDDVAKEKLKALNAVDAFLYVDGHVQCYYGKKKVGKVFSNSKKKVVKGATDYWANLEDGTPLLCIATEFNAHLNAVLPSIIAQAQKLCGEKRLTVIFDRGGADALTYEKIIAADCDFIAYHKTPAPVDLDDFVKEETVVGNRTYDYQLLDRSASIPVYEKSSKNKSRRKTDRTVDVREIMIRRNDDGVTHVITNRHDLAGKKVCEALFRRWVQENFFKYMIETYNFDHLFTYRTQKVSPDIDHPNPEYNQLMRQQKKLRSRIAAVIGAAKLDSIADNKLDELVDLHKGKKGAELKKLSGTLKGVKQALKQTPKRESAGNYDKLDSESRIIGNAVKSAAYDAEGILATMVKNIWNGVNGNERGIVEGFMKTTGSIKVDGSLLKVTLQPQATPERTKLLKHVCDELTVMTTKYPGSDLRMVFEIAR